MDTFGAETGGVVWSKRRREENTKNSEAVPVALSFTFRAVLLLSHVPSEVGPHMACCEQVRLRGFCAEGFGLHVS